MEAKEAYRAEILLDLLVRPDPKHFHGLVVRLNRKVWFVRVEGDLRDTVRRREGKGGDRMDELGDLCRERTLE